MSGKIRKTAFMRVGPWLVGMSESALGDVYFDVESRGSDMNADLILLPNPRLATFSRIMESAAP